MLNVVLVNGGRGAGTLIPTLLSTSGVNLTSIVNAYDDGKSTGEIRQAIGMLGPSDIRKVQGLMLPNDIDERDAIIALFDYRFPLDSSHDQVVAVLKSYAEGKSANIAGIEILNKKIRDSIRMFLSRFVKGLDVSERTRGRQMNFGDCSLMNCIYAGAFLHFDRNLEEAALFIGKLFRLKGTVLPTSIEDKKLVAIRNNGDILYSEAEIVELRSNVRIKKIFLLDGYPKKEFFETMSPEERLDYLELNNSFVSIAERVERVLKDADIIIYAPGTQHSSLYPSFMSKGFARTVAENRRALKVFITNIGEDYETPSYTATDYVTGALRYLHLSNGGPLPAAELFSHVFVNSRFSGNLENYVKYDEKELNGIGSTIVIDEFEAVSNPGKHDGKKIIERVMALYDEHSALRHNGHVRHS